MGEFADTLFSSRSASDPRWNFLDAILYIKVSAIFYFYENIEIIAVIFEGYLEVFLGATAS